MSVDLVSVIQAIVACELQSFRTAELGVVTAVYSHEQSSDKNNYECDVQLRDCGLELKRVAIATQRVGAVSIPNVDDLVLVQFLNGDINSAIVTARLYHDQVRPPVAKQHEFVYLSPDDDKAGVRRFRLELPKKNTLLVDDDKLVVEMGKTTLTMNNDGQVELKSNDSDITITDRSGNNLMKIAVQPGEVTVQAKARVVIDAPQIELVGGAIHPLVFGDDLLQYLNQIVSTYASHVHPGQTAMGMPVSPAPPVPPLPTATPSLLSTKTKTG